MLKIALFLLLAFPMSSLEGAETTSPSLAPPVDDAALALNLAGDPPPQVDCHALSKQIQNLQSAIEDSEIFLASFTNLVEATKARLAADPDNEDLQEQLALWEAHLEWEQNHLATLNATLAHLEFLYLEFCQH